jgi:hypothetical protein
MYRLWRSFAVVAGILATTTFAPSIGFAASSNLMPGVVDSSILRTPTVGQVVAQGKLTDSSGHPTSGTVAAVAWPAESLNKTFKIGDRIPTPTVGWTSAGSNGAFTLRVDRTRLPSGYVSPSGQLDLIVVGWSAGHVGQWSMSTTLASGSPTSSLAPLSSGAGSTANISIRLKDSVIASPAAAMGRLAPITNTPDAIGCYYILKSTYLAWDNAGESFPWYYSTTSGFSVSSSHGVTLGVGTSSSGAYGSFSNTGSYSTSAGVSNTWAKTPDDRTYRVQTQYGKYQNICTVWMARPIQPTGGSQTVYTGWTNFCGSHKWAPEAGGTEFKRVSGSGYHFYQSGGVQTAPWIGINLSYDSNYATDTWVTYDFAVDSKLCGNNNYPAWAGRINEYPYAT